jgi:hypothetical protein
MQPIFRRTYPGPGITLGPEIGEADFAGAGSIRRMLILTALESARAISSPDRSVCFLHLA